MLKKKEIWDLISTSLESHISKREFKTWFSRVRLKELNPDLAVLEVPNKYVATWLDENYGDLIRRSFKDGPGLVPQIRFTYTTPASEKETYKKASKEPQSPFTSPLNPLWTFSTFITDPGNRFAYASALDVAKTPAGPYNPLYIFSKPSLGKTHLLNAIGNFALYENPSTPVRYITADQFASDYSLAFKKGALSELRASYRHFQFLLLDNIDVLTAHAKPQQELTALFDFFQTSQRQIVVAGKPPPRAIDFLVPQLRSRLESGLISEIQFPTRKTKLRIIEQRAKEEGLDIPDDVAFFLANTTNDLKTLIQYIIHVGTLASLYQRRIDMSTVKSIIKDKPRQRTDVHDIQRIICEHFNISLSDLLSNKKKREYSYPRQLAMYLSREVIGLSFKDIGKAFGNRNHSTVIYAVKRVRSDKARKKEILDDIHSLQSLLS